MISTLDFKQFKGLTFRIDKVYPRYRVSNFVKGERTVEYIEFPYTEDEVLENGSERIKEVKELPMEGRTMFRAKSYEDGIYKYTKVVNDKAFFANTGKVFDIDIAFDTPIDVTYYKGETLTESVTEVQIKRVSAGKIKDMITRVCKEKPELVEGKDKLGNTKDAKGNPVMVKPYDYEDTYKKFLEGKFVEMDYDGVGIDTKYIFAKGEAFLGSQANLDDEPFGASVSDIPF